MPRRQIVYLIGIVVAAAGMLTGTLVAGNEPLLGLDLQGGISVRYRATAPVEDPEQIDQAVEIIRNRVDGLGVAEPEIQAQGDGILVSLPGVEDKERALELVGDTAVMRFRPVLEDLPLGSVERPASLPEDAPLDADGFTPVDAIEEDSIIVVPSNVDLAFPGRYVLGPAGMSGEGLSDAQAQFTGLEWIISVDLKGGAIGEDAFRSLTEMCASGVDPACPGSIDGSGQVRGRIAVDLDNEVISAPFVQSNDLGDSFQISGSFDEDSAKELALKLRFGALPIELEPENQQIVSATIGQDALRAGIIAGLIGLVLVAIYIITIYRMLGVIAMVSLAISAALLWSIIAFLGEYQGLALTLAGITGIIVSIGVSVDSNIVYFEHLREDVRNGRTFRTAVDKAFPVAFSTIVKADVASLIGAVLLYWLTVGAVRGFALYLGIATLLDLVATYFFLGPAVQWLARRPGIADSPALLGVPGVGPEGTKAPTGLSRSFDFPALWRRALIVSASLVVISVLALAGRGLNLGIDFEGGTSFEVATEASIDDISAALPPGVAAEARIQEVIDDETGERLVRVRSAVEEAEAVEELRGVLSGQGIITAFESVGPTWGQAITDQAVRALIFFFIAIALYISVRLEWKMALGALAAVAHDIILSVGVYAVFGFEVTPATVIAFLTIMGYSLYDTIVVYDKVREITARVGATGRYTYTEMMNLALNQVLGRSINTTVSSILPVLSMLVIGSFLLGATTLAEFSVALLVGLIVGGYSSIFVASAVVSHLKEREPEYEQIAKRVAKRSGDTDGATRQVTAEDATFGIQAGRMRRGPDDGEQAASAPAPTKTRTPAPATAIPPRPRKTKRKK